MNERIVMAKTIVAGDVYRDIDGQLFELKRQLRQPDGYPFDLAKLKVALQQIIEGNFNTPAGSVLRSAQAPLFKVEYTNLAKAIADTEKFSWKVLGAKVNISQMFDLPKELPWKDVLVIYDPGLSNREAVEKALQSQKLAVYEESKVMEYSGSQANNQPTLRIIQNSLSPTENTLGSNAKSPDQLNTDGRNYLDLRGYTLAFGLRYFIHSDHLDSETWTLFPKNLLLSGGVARSYWNPRHGVMFCWSGVDDVYHQCGARLSIDVPLKS